MRGENITEQRLPLVDPVRNDVGDAHWVTGRDFYWLGQLQQRIQGPEEILSYLAHMPDLAAAICGAYDAVTEYFPYFRSHHGTITAAALVQGKRPSSQSFPYRTTVTWEIVCHVPEGEAKAAQEMTDDFIAPYWVMKLRERM